MSPTVVFLWISAASDPPSGGRAPAPDAEVAAQRSPRAPGSPARDTGPLTLLRDYGARRGLRFIELDAVSRSRPTGPWPSSGTLADELEAELEQAATALSALEEAAALERLSRIEAALRAHPDLPQASVLLAETLALRARATAPTDAELALSLEGRRFALEGQRATAFGETLTAGSAPPVLELTVRGLDHVDELELDGTPQTSREVALAAGLHQVRVFRAGWLVHAGFYEVSEGATELSLDVPSLVPCSADDLGGLDANALASGAPVPPGVKCARFALVRPATASVEIALCSPERCGPFVRWQSRPEPVFRPIAIERGFPAWAGFAIAGATALVATSLVLWQAGAFDEGRPNAVRWEYGGLDPAPSAVRF